MEKMDRLFVFGIGGSGERVMRSLIMLIAGGMPMNCGTIVPVLIDSDEKSKALTKVNELIDAYNKASKLFDKDSNFVNDELVKQNSMFHVKIESPLLLNVSGTDVETLKKLVDSQNLEKISPDLKAEFDMLYSEMSQNMKLSWGFVGNPSIGAIVLNQMLESDKYKTLKPTNKDGIFIISSIFGGTGAAGFPLLVNKLRSDFDGQFDGVRIGALSMFPYFRLKDVNDDSEVAKGLKDYDVNESEFSTKTKAALTYYAEHVKALSSMYYLGAGDVQYRSLYPKFKGGEKQDNPAAMLEVLGAKAVSHFTFNAKGIKNEDNDNDFKDFTTYYEYFLKKEPKNGECYNLETIDPDVSFREVFIRLQLLKYIWKDLVPGYIRDKLTWATSIGMEDGRYKSLMATYLSLFFEHFEQWKGELRSSAHDSGFKFRFFNDDEASWNSQEYVTQLFYPSVANTKIEGIFKKEVKIIDPKIINKMQKPAVKGEGFNSDDNRFRYAFYTTLYAIEHMLKDNGAEKCINLTFNK